MLRKYFSKNVKSADVVVMNVSGISSHSLADTDARIFVEIPLQSIRDFDRSPKCTRMSARPRSVHTHAEIPVWFCSRRTYKLCAIKFRRDIKFARIWNSRVYTTLGDKTRSIQCRGKIRQKFIPKSTHTARHRLRGCRSLKKNPPCISQYESLRVCAVNFLED